MSSDWFDTIVNYEPGDGLLLRRIIFRIVEGLLAFMGLVLILEILLFIALFSGLLDPLLISWGLK